MVKVVKSTDENFAQFLDELMDVSSKAEMTPEVSNSAKKICDDVMKRGDEAIVEYTNMFDGTNVSSVDELKVTETEIQLAYSAVSANVIEALEVAAQRIESYHVKQMPQDIDYKDDIGVRLGNIWKPIKNAGIYVPGGLASYPSSVLMNAVPAKVAGVKNIVMVVPAPNGELNPVVLAAAKIAGVSNIYKVGGAQAIAALATGKGAIPRVDVIVGPGNAYVAAAKRYFSGYVGIDMIAGPSEILVVADKENSPEWVATDLLSQAEHDENARSILITDDEEFAVSVIEAVDKISVNLDRAEIAGRSWEENGAVILVEDIKKDAVSLIDWIAPEHLELALDDELSNYLIKNLRNAGAVFIGRYTPEAIGDYMAGPSHVLPTAGTARFSSGLSVYDFLKRVSLIGCDKESFDKLAKSTASLADEEGLGAHALSIRARHDR